MAAIIFLLACTSPSRSARRSTRLSSIASGLSAASRASISLSVSFILRLVTKLSILEMPFLDLILSSSSSFLALRASCFASLDSAISASKLSHLFFRASPVRFSSRAFISSSSLRMALLVKGLNILESPLLDSRVSASAFLAFLVASNLAISASIFSLKSSSAAFTFFNSSCLSSSSRMAARSSAIRSSFSSMACNLASACL